MSLVTQIRLYIIWNQLKKYLLLVFLAIFLFLIIDYRDYLSSYFVSNFPAILSILQNSFIATVIGAVVGGAIALYGSMYVQRNQVKAEAAIRRRDVIFIPLFNELLAINRKLQENPCPDFIITHEREKNPNYPRFVVWRSFKESSNYLQVPRLLSKSLDRFIEAINFYRDTRIAAIQDKELDIVIRQIITEYSERNSQRLDLTYHYLPCNDNLSKIIDHLEGDTSVPKTDEGKKPVTKLVRTKSDDELKVIAKRIYQECSAVDSVKKNQVARQNLEKQLLELIQSLEIIIRYINEKFEQNEKWF